MGLVVTTPAESFDLCSLADVKLALGITGNDENDSLNALIARASDAIARQCKRVFGLETVSETFRNSLLSKELVLSRFPVTAISAVVENDTTIDSGDVEFDSATGILSRLHLGARLCWWPSGTIVVSYSAGYSLPSAAPESLRQACIQQVAAWRASAQRDPALRSETYDDVMTASYQVSTGMLPEIAALVRPFRDMRVR